MRTASGTVNVNYLFDSAGRWIAFRKRQYVFNCDSQWIGWTPWGDNEVYAPNGSYLGTITYGNRLYYYHQREDRGLPGTVEAPPFPGTYSDPVSPGRAVLLPWAEDLDFSSFHDEMDWSSDLGSDVVQDLGFTSSITSYRKKEVYNATRAENLPTLDLDVESLSQSEPVHIQSSVNERNISHRRYEDDYDDYDHRPVTRPRPRYEDEYDDYDRRPARPRQRYEDEYDDYDRRPVRPRSRYEDEYDDYDRRPARPRQRYEDEYDDYDRRPVRPRPRYEDEYDDYDRRPARPRQRYEDEYDDYDRRPVRPRPRYEDEYDDYDRRPARSKSRYDDEDDYDDRRRQSAQSRRNDEDEEFNRKKEIDRLRLIISKHAEKTKDENDTLLQPLKKSN